jgi:hypothetical protein
VRNGEATLSTAERSRLVFANGVLDALVSEGPLAQRVPLAEGVGALPSSREIEISVVADRLAIREISPVETTLLLVVAHVLAVIGCAVVVEKVPVCRGLLGSEASNQKSVSGLHGEIRVSNSNLNVAIKINVCCNWTLNE